MPTKKKVTSTKKKVSGRPGPERPSFSEIYEKALEQYSAALELLHKKDYSGALERFEQLASDYPEEPELAERSRTYANVCRARLNPSHYEPQSVNDLYQLGVLRANSGLLDEALDAFNKALDSDPTAAEYLYARASVYALKGHAEPAAADLRRAVEIEPALRFQAVNDPDFDTVRDDAAFIDVIEPTRAGA